MQFKYTIRLPARRPRAGRRGSSGRTRWFVLAIQRVRRFPAPKHLGRPCRFALYPKFQEYLRTWRPPLLAVWGKNDPFFLPPGAEAFKRDIPDAEIHLLDAGHFALESQGREIATIIRDFLGRNLMKQSQPLSHQHPQKGVLLCRGRSSSSAPVLVLAATPPKRAPAI